MEKIVKYIPTVKDTSFDFCNKKQIAPANILDKKCSKNLQDGVGTSPGATKIVEKKKKFHLREKTP